MLNFFFFFWRKLEWKSIYSHTRLHTDGRLLPRQVLSAPLRVVHGLDLAQLAIKHVGLKCPAQGHNDRLVGAETAEASVIALCSGYL